MAFTACKNHRRRECPRLIAGRRYQLHFGA
nr:MAG TPA: hypothetical protein [Bacteriophage sp.]